MTRIQLRRDTSSNWQTNNPTPSLGEPCYETDTKKLKIGDGVTKYNDLQYFAGGTGGTTDYTQLTNKPQINGIELTGNKNGNDLGLANESEIEELGNELNQLANDVTNLDTNKQNKLTAGTGIKLENETVYLNQQANNSNIIYSNNDSTFGYINYAENKYYQLETTDVPDSKVGMNILAFDTPIDNIMSFDYMTVVTLTNYSAGKDRRIIQVGDGNNCCWIDSFAGNYCRAVYSVNGATTQIQRIISTSSTPIAFRLKADGTNLKIYANSVPNGLLPQEEDWVLKDTVDFNLTQYPLTTNSEYIYYLGGVCRTQDGIIITQNTHPATFNLAQTKLTVNNIQISNGSLINNSAIATDKLLGLIKFDNNSLVYNNNQQLTVNKYDDITTQGNVFNGSNQLVKLDSTGKLPAIDGSQLTNLPAGEAPTNMVTTDTPQDITRTKTFVGNVPVRIKNTDINKVAAPFRLWQSSVAGNKIFIGDCPDGGLSTSGLPVAIVVPNKDKTVYKTNTGDLNTFVPILDEDNYNNYTYTKTETDNLLDTKVNTSDMVEVPVVIEQSDKSLMPSWYRVWSNGWIEQGGQISVTNTTTVNLLKPYTQTNYLPNTQAIGNQANAFVSPIDTNSFSITSSASTAQDFNWYCVGY